MYLEKANYTNDKKQQTQNTTNNKPRIYWIDFTRGFACLFVLLVHSPFPYIGQDGRFILGFMTYLGQTGGSNIFFMISGAVMLYRERETFPFLKKQLLKIVPPVIVWTFIFLLINCFIYKEFDSNTLLKKILMIPFGTQEPTFWFIYVLIGIYLLTPILSYFLNRASQKEITFYLFIWALSTLIPYLNFIDENIGKHLTHKVGWLYYFNGYIGYAVLGFYCRKFITIYYKKWKHCIIFTFTMCICLPIILNYLECPTSVICNRLSLHEVLMSFSIFVLLKNYIKPHKYSHYLTKFARFTFGIYLVQGIFIKILRLFLNPFKLNYFIQIPLTILILGICSFSLVWLVSRFPYSKYIVGPVREK